MAYEFERDLIGLTTAALRNAHAAYLEDDEERFAEHLMEAASAIDSIERMGLAADNPRFLWVDRLNRDWELVASFARVREPRELVKVYQCCGDMQLPLPSLALDVSAPYLPRSCGDVFDFYGGSLAPAEATAEDLRRAVALYGGLTGGGGAGVDLLFLAGLALRRGDGERSRALASQAREAGAPWLLPLAEAVLRQAEG